ncbi:MAG: dihydrofolate reductase family protein [Sandaracinaceae bacterium]
MSVVETPSNAQLVARRAASLYGSPLGSAEGVLHVTAVARTDDGLRVMRIGPAPRSPTDFFALSLTRARVDAVVVTGGVLRAEPELRYDLAPSLRTWRGADGPLLLVMTRGANLPSQHPVWESEAQPLVLTGARAAAELRRALPSRVEVVGVEAPSGRAALDYLQRERGCRSVSIEAGPSVAVPLYDAPNRIDEVVLSVYEGALPDVARGGAYIEESRLHAEFERVGGPTRVDEPSGPWVFSRWLRR